MTTIALLSARFDAVEAMVLRSPDSARQPQGSALFLQERVAKMSNFLDNAEGEVPAVKACRTLSKRQTVEVRICIQMDLPKQSLLRPLHSPLQPHPAASKLWPLVSQSKASLTSVLERIDELRATKTDLENMISMLSQIETFSQNVLSDEAAPIIALKDRVLALEQQLEPLTVEAAKQAAELDDFLDNYEAAVSVFFFLICDFEMN